MCNDSDYCYICRLLYGFSVSGIMCQENEYSKWCGDYKNDMCMKYHILRDEYANKNEKMKQNELKPHIFRGIIFLKSGHLWKISFSK